MHKGASWSSATTAACSGKLTVCSKQGLREGKDDAFCTFNDTTSLEFQLFRSFLCPVLQDRLKRKIMLVYPSFIFSLSLACHTGYRIDTKS